MACLFASLVFGDMSPSRPT